MLGGGGGLEGVHFHMFSQLSQNAFLAILSIFEGSTLSLFSTQDLGLECNNEFQDLGPELNIAFRT